MKGTMWCVALLLAAVCSIAEGQVHACQTDPDGNFPCDNGNTNVLCDKWKNNNDDCGDNSDEQHPCEKDSSGTFTCNNGNTIPCTKFQDKRNDCEDNSDEGYLYSCPTKTISGVVYNQFKCSMNDGNTADWSTGHCTPIIFRKDNGSDCPDDSDEQIYIGDACLNGLTEFTCVKYMPESFCNSSFQCECKSGRKVIDEGTNCALRVLGDACEVRADCWDSRAGLVCDATHKNCTCEVGYYEDVTDPGFCIPNKIYENCTIDAECSTPIPNSQCDNLTCQCEFDYLVGSLNATCNIRKLNDPCSVDTQCQKGMTYSKCGDNSTCECQLGSFANEAGTDCIKRFVDDNCTESTDCNLITHGVCDDATKTCKCNPSSLYVDYLKGSCAYGLTELHCDSDVNCTLHFTNSACDNNVCKCASTYYENGWVNCERFKVGDNKKCDSADCTHIANAECEAGTSTCRCKSGFNYQGEGCVAGEASTACDTFACQYPWAIALLVIGLLGIGVVVVILLIKRPWKKPEDDKKVEPTSGAHYTNGGLSYDGEHGKPVWTLRPKSGNPVMYDHMHLREPNDPEVDHFFSGGLTSVEIPDRAHLIDNDRKVRFDESVPATPMTPGNIDVGMIGETEDPIPEEDDEPGEDGEKPEKGKKGKKTKKEKGGKKKKGKGKK